MALARVQHRLRQFVGALRPRIDTQLRAEAFGLLRDPERQLFGTMTLRDQQHGLDVYRRLQSSATCWSPPCCTTWARGASPFGTEWPTYCWRQDRPGCCAER